MRARAAIATVLLLTSSLLAGYALYSQIEYAPWTSAESFAGHGGAMHEIGDYRVLGIRCARASVQNSRRHQTEHAPAFHAVVLYNKTQITKQIKQAGGDGVIAINDRADLAEDCSYSMAAQLYSEHGGTRQWALAVFAYLDNTTQTTNAPLAEQHRMTKAIFAAALFVADSAA